jgi:hypothetical protein
LIDDFFKDPDVARVLRSILRAKGVANQDLDDCVHDVYEAVLNWSRQTGTVDREALGKYAGGAAKNLGTNYWRTVATRGKHNVGATDAADEHSKAESPRAVELPDLNKVIDEIERMRALGKLTEKGAAVLRAIAEEKTLEEHANETGQSPEAVRQTARRSKDAVVEHLKERGLVDVWVGRLTSARGIAAIAVAVVLGLLILSGRLAGLFNQPFAHRDSPGTAADAGAEPLRETDEQALARIQERRDKVDALLRRADVEYRRMEWRSCIQALDEATTLDPSLDVSLSRNECLAREKQDSNSKLDRKHP